MPAHFFRNMAKTANARPDGMVDKTAGMVDKMAEMSDKMAGMGEEMAHMRADRQ